MEKIRLSEPVSCKMNETYEVIKEVMKVYSLKLK